MLGTLVGTVRLRLKVSGGKQREGDGLLCFEDLCLDGLFCVRWVLLGGVT